MAKTIYEFRDYREYLQTALPVSGLGRGSRNRLAEALNCQKGFISQVLGGSVHFSPEHAIKISRFLQHDLAEEEFFLLLVHLGRSGSQDLADFYKKKMKEILETRKQIKERIKADSTLSESDQMLYYSSWHYTAVHMCLMVPHLRTRKEMCEYLGLSTETISRVLSFFLSRGLAEQKGNEFFAGPVRIHLPSDSPLISKHHANWRMQAVSSLDHQRPKDMHYSLIMSLSEDAAEKIKNILLNSVQEIEPVLKLAKDETVYALNMDLFNVSR
jgi:uncharacterized protein (TIGR02147 family)